MSAPETTTRPDTTSPGNVLSRIAEIQGMNNAQLTERWKLLMNVPPPGSREAMRQRLIYRVQEMTHGGLRPETRARLDTIARGGKTGGGKAPVAGTVFRREWHGTVHEVRTVEGGFEWDGRKYKSLTATAKAITGQHWSGNLFFGVTTRKKRGGAK